MARTVLLGFTERIATIASSVVTVRSTWSPFDDYASARDYAERMRGEFWAHLYIDC